MGFLQYRAICSFSMSVLLGLNVNILDVRVIDQSCGIGLVFSDREGMKQKKDRGGGGGGGGGGGDYSRAVIISNILTKRGRLFEGGD